MDGCRHVRLELDDHPQALSLQTPPQVEQWIPTDEAPAFYARCLDCGARFQMHAGIDVSPTVEVKMDAPA